VSSPSSTDSTSRLVIWAKARVLGDFGQLVGQHVQNSVELGVHGCGVRLVVGRVQQRPHLADPGAYSHGPHARPETRITR
jgi:hypothetical protein